MKTGENIRKCARCRTGLSSDVPGGHCLACLLKLGLEKLSEEETGETEGERIGPYRLIRQIGEGGCGVVYLAEQKEPVRRQVALKMIKLGMDTKSVIARFEGERQALALMDHPNIARVFDAGATAEGRPYFVMELVSGRKITQYCDEKKLSIAERLKLFLQACLAIQHAHQKGIIHRDIKPSNILVADDAQEQPVLKVIDFGIAKAITGERLADDTFFTAFEQFIGTPSYMSPEQAGMAGWDIDTRSDVYSLGVLLYEMLTGQPPFDAGELRSATFDEVFRIIREHEPLLPSARVIAMNKSERLELANCRQVHAARLPKLLRGDLDWILATAMEKNRSRRYSTVNGLAEDIGRHLDETPVLAGPRSTFYQAAKFIFKHRRALLFFLLLWTGIISACIYQYIGYRQDMAETLSMMAGQTAKNCSPAVTFGDEKMAQEILSVFKTDPRVEAAAIFPKDRRFLAAYPTDSSGLIFQPLPVGDTVRWQSSELTIFHTIEEDKRILGIICIRYRVRTLPNGSMGLLLVAGLLPIVFVVFQRSKRTNKLVASNN